jgi:hypothetical protein
MKKNLETKTPTAPPLLTIESPNNHIRTIQLNKSKLIIGRLKNRNDISLEPDPHKLVTRYMHCSIEYEINSFWIIDNASKNGTFIQQNEQIKKVYGKEKLNNNDTILILGGIDSDGMPKYWKLIFIDPHATENIKNIFQQDYLDYEWAQAKLFVYEKKQKKEIAGLTPQEHKLIRFMQQKNYNNRNNPVMCSFEDIMEAVWDERKSTRTKNDVNHLIAGLRKKVEVNPDEPKYIINVRGLGYRLITKMSLF